MSTLPPGTDRFLAFFVPERWSPLDRLRKLTGAPFPDRGLYIEGLMMVAAHLEKYVVLAGLANRLSPELEKDHEELAQHGFTPALRGKEFTAVTETLVCELYAVLDGLRRTLCGAYPKANLPDKTSRLFKNAQEGKTRALPEEIRVPLALAQESWFPLLRTFRVSVTHRESGHAFWVKETGLVRYMHTSFVDGPPSFVCEDITSLLNERHEQVVGLVDTIATFMLSQLLPGERRVICGTYKARMYERTVSNREPLTRQSGRCYSREWFEKEEGYACPMRESCDAYSAAVAAAGPPASE